MFLRFFRVLGSLVGVFGLFSGLLDLFQMLGALVSPEWLLSGPNLAASSEYSHWHVG